jgi:uncharacterized sulfatase
MNGIGGRDRRREGTMDRRAFLRRVALGAAALAAPRAATSEPPPASAASAAGRPNVLVFVADDLSWAHTGFAGGPFVRTPNFDRVAREGAYFENAFSSAPICTPTRGSLLTGLSPWQLEDGMQLLGTLPARFETYPAALEQAGYFAGFTGKGWGPGNWRASGRTADPAGTPFYSEMLAEAPTTGMRKNDLPGNFRAFLEARPAGRPFCFWYGSFEPHVPYEAGSGIRAGLRPETVVVPPFLPDTPEVRSDLLDYALEIQYLDAQLGACLDALEKAGELDRTLIVVVGDNGLPFPAAKHTCYEYGVHVPLALRWGARIPAGRRVTEPVSTPDLTATIYAAAGVTPARPLAGADLVPGLVAPRGGRCLPDREFVVLAHERGNLCREGDVGYPIRAIRGARHLYIRNYAPDRWPCGDPDQYGDVDPIPTKQLLIDRRDDPAIRPFFERAMGKRPVEELYDVVDDPACLKNLAGDPARRALMDALREKMESRLKADGDWRVLGEGDRYERIPVATGRRPAEKRNE